MDEQTNALDGIIARKLARIHPLNLPLLRAQLLLVLAGTTGIEPGDHALAELAMARDVEDLARVDWERFSIGVSTATCVPEQACRALVEHIRLFAERAVLHHCLCLSKSASTLGLMNAWPIRPGDVPNELVPIYEEFAHRLAEADAALESGRACLHALGRQVLAHSSISPLQGLLKRANTCYADYLQALDQADQLASYMLSCLAQTQEEKADESREMARSAWHAA